MLDENLASHIITTSLRKVGVDPTMSASWVPAADLEQLLLEKVTAGRISVAEGAARLLTDRPGRYAPPDRFDVLAAVRVRLEQFLEHCAVKSGLPVDDLVERVGLALDRAGDGWRGSGALAEMNEILLGEPAASRATVIRYLWTELVEPRRPGWGYAVALVDSLVRADSDGLVDVTPLLDWSGDAELGDLRNLEALVFDAYAAGRPHAAALATVRRGAVRINRPDDRLWSLWPVLNVGEAWTDRANADLDALPAADRDAWAALLRHAATSGQSKQLRPTARWRATARPLLDEVDPAGFAAKVAGWMELVGYARTLPLRTHPAAAPHLDEVIDPWNLPMLHGLVWLLPSCPPNEAAIRALGVVVGVAVQRVEHVGPRHPRLANAAVWALSTMDHPAAHTQLRRLLTEVDYPVTRRAIDRALTTWPAPLK